MGKLIDVNHYKKKKIEPFNVLKTHICKFIIYVIKNLLWLIKAETKNSETFIQRQKINVHIFIFFINSMNVEEYLEEMKNIQTIILDFLENETDAEVNFQKLYFLLNDKKIHDKKYKVKSILY